MSLNKFQIKENYGGKRKGTSYYLYVSNDKETIVLGDLKEKSHEELWKENKTVLEKKGIKDFPSLLAINIDSNCNLRCPICRKEIRANTPNEENIDLIYEEILSIANKMEIISTAVGEVFINKRKINLLKSISNDNLKKITLFTNAIALTPSLWADLKVLHDKATLIVSIDAATKETYEVNRPPAKWEKLLERLEFLKEERKTKNFILNFAFVIQKNNYKEIPQFIEMSRKYGANYKWHLPLYWGSSTAYTEEQYKDLIEVHNPEHPEFNELLKILKNNDIKVSDLRGCGHWYL